MTFLLLPVIFFLGLTILARVLNEKALKQLSAEQKGLLIQAFSKTRIITVVALSVMILAFLLLSQTSAINSWMLMYLYFGGVLLYIVGISVFGYFKQRQLQLPATYLKWYLYSVIARTIAMIILILGMMLYFQNADKSI
ncbi:MAG: hypothetical protein JNK73_02555 [Bacteroidia bacterium]|nr:hypothetical protein [Bacteroidia bacterium]